MVGGLLIGEWRSICGSGNKFMIRTGYSFKVAFRREVGYVANVEL